MMRLLWFLAHLLLLSTQLKRGQLLTGYDCMHKSTEGVAISTYNVDDCAEYYSPSNVTTRYIQVISEKKHEQVILTACTLIRNSIIYRCGAFDHAMLVPNSLSIGISSDLSADDCNRIITRGVYITETGSKIEGINRDETVHFNSVDAGNTDTNGKCEGVTLISQGVTYSKAVKVSHYKLTVKQIAAKKIIKSGVIVTQEGYTCKYTQGTCFVQDLGRMIWDVKESNSPCGNRQYDILYEGWANETDSATSPLVLTVESHKVNFALSVKEKQIICGYNGYRTDDEDVQIIYGDPSGMPKFDTIRDTYDFNPFFDTNLKFIFLERNIANRTTDLYNYFLRRYCDMNRSRLRHLLSLARTDPEEFAWVYTDKAGYTAVTRGEALHLVRCHPVQVEPRHTEECYHDLPVTYNNNSMFLKPGSRLLVKLGRPIPCSTLTPVLYKIDGTWTKIGGESYPVHPPLSLSPNPVDIWKYGSVVTLENIGFLSKQQLEDYRDAIIGPIERKAVKDIFISRVTSHGQTGSQGLNFNDGIHPDQIIDKVSDSVISRLYGYWDFLARNIGAILGISLLWHMVCYVFHFIVNGCLMYKEYGLIGLIIAAASNTVSKHLIYGRLRPFWRRKGTTVEKGCDNEQTGHELDEGIQIPIDNIIRGRDSVYPEVPSGPPPSPPSGYRQVPFRQD